jgi:hypothetical protein
MAVTPAQPGCGTLLSLFLLLGAWNTGDVAYPVSTIALTLAVYGIPLAAILAAVRQRSELVRIVIVWAWTVAFLVLFLAGPMAHDCP